MCIRDRCYAPRYQPKKRNKSVMCISIQGASRLDSVLRNSMLGFSCLGPTLPNERAITQRCVPWSSWFFKMILLHRISIHTPSLVKIGWAVFEIWALPVFVAQLGTALLNCHNFLDLCICIVYPATCQLLSKSAQRLLRKKRSKCDSRTDSLILILW